MSQFTSWAGLYKTKENIVVAMATKAKEVFLPLRLADIGSGRLQAMLPEQDKIDLHLNTLIQDTSLSAQIPGYTMPLPMFMTIRKKRWEELKKSKLVTLKPVSRWALHFHTWWGMTSPSLGFE